MFKCHPILLLNKNVHNLSYIVYNLLDLVDCRRVVLAGKCPQYCPKMSVSIACMPAIFSMSGYLIIRKYVIKLGQLWDVQLPNLNLSAGRVLCTALG